MKTEEEIMEILKEKLNNRHKLLNCNELQFYDEVLKTLQNEIEILKCVLNMERGE